ncbi:MAG TPA: hypothetical protein VM263_10320 [Acidimicrobiales bacterium]|nr:hypothetical protein [Acidimicrobiales bacterium]
MRNARAEAAGRLEGRHDVRVLEPSPPAVGVPPWFADDPVAGGDVVPLERPGTRSWAAVCDDEGDDDLLSFCEDRWLVRPSLRPLPASFAETRRSLHVLAEHVVAPCRHASTGRIGLRFTYHGFGTPFFGADRQVRVEDGALVDGDRRRALTTVGEAGAFLGLVAPAATGVYEPTTPARPDDALPVDPAAARALGDWFGFSTSVLEQVRDEATAGDQPSRVQLWPEHFDVAVDLGPDGARANFGGSPGDEGHAEPYLYVGPWERRTGGFWNEDFGASLSYRELLDGADPLAFLRRGRELLR